MSQKTFINCEWFSSFFSVLVSLWHLVNGCFCPMYSMPLLSFRSGYLKRSCRRKPISWWYIVHGVNHLLPSPQLSSFYPINTENPIQAYLSTAFHFIAIHRFFFYKLRQDLPPAKRRLVLLQWFGSKPAIFLRYACPLKALAWFLSQPCRTVLFQASRVHSTFPYTGNPGPSHCCMVFQSSWMAALLTSQRLPGVHLFPSFNNLPY